MTKNLFVRVLTLVAFGIGSLTVELATARTRYLLDLDGTQVRFRTPWILRRIDKLRNTLQPNPQALGLPERIEITESEYRQYAVFFGKGDQRIGSLNSLFLNPDPFLKRPVSIIPGFYTIDPEITFKEFRPLNDRRGYLRRHLDQAQERVQHKLVEDDGTPYAWEGPAMPLVVKALSSKSTVRNLVTASARSLGEGEYEKYLKGLRRLKLIRHIKDRHGRVPRFISLGAPDSLLLGRGDEKRSRRSTDDPDRSPLGAGK